MPPKTHKKNKRGGGEPTSLVDSEPKRRKVPTPQQQPQQQLQQLQQQLQHQPQQQPQQPQQQLQQPQQQPAKQNALAKFMVLCRADFVSHIFHRLVLHRLLFYSADPFFTFTLPSSSFGNGKVGMFYGSKWSLKISRSSIIRLGQRPLITASFLMITNLTRKR